MFSHIELGIVAYCYLRLKKYPFSVKRPTLEWEKNMFLKMARLHLKFKSTPFLKSIKY